MNLAAEFRLASGGENLLPEKSRPVRFMPRLSAEAAVLRNFAMDHRPTPSGCPSYLVVDDDSAFAERVVRALTRAGSVMVGTAATYEDALTAMVERSWNRVLAELAVGNPHRICRFLRAVRIASPETSVVIATDYPSLEAFRRALSLGAIDLIRKTDDVTIIDQAFAGAADDSDEFPQSLAPPTLDQVEFEHITRVLWLADGNMVLAARILGVNRPTLYRRIQRPPTVNIARLRRVGSELALLRADAKHRESRAPRRRRETRPRSESD